MGFALNFCEVATEWVQELCLRIKIDARGMPLGSVSMKSKSMPSAAFEEVVNFIVAERNTAQLVSLRKFDGGSNGTGSQRGTWKCYTTLLVMCYIHVFYS